MNLVKAIPYSGVQPACFALLLLCIDRADEYQLVQFVLSFKSIQFVTSGVIASLLGGASYFTCMTLHPLQHTCAEDGPGASSNVYFDGIGFLVMVLLTWAAMLLMRSAVPKGGSFHFGRRLVGDTIVIQEKGQRRRRASVVGFNRRSGMHTIKYEGGGVASSGDLEAELAEVVDDLGLGEPAVGGVGVPPRPVLLQEVVEAARSEE